MFQSVRGIHVTRIIVAGVHQLIQAGIVMSTNYLVNASMVYRMSLICTSSLQLFSVLSQLKGTITKKLSNVKHFVPLNYCKRLICMTQTFAKHSNSTEIISRPLSGGSTKHMYVMPLIEPYDRGTSYLQRDKQWRFNQWHHVAST